MGPKKKKDREKSENYECSEMDFTEAIKRKSSHDDDLLLKTSQFNQGNPNKIRAITHSQSVKQNLHSKNSTPLNPSFSSDKKTTNQYNHNNQGPYGVWVKKIKPDNTDLSAYKLGSILWKNYVGFEVIRKGRYKSEILFKKSDDANRLLTDKSLVDHNLECFLPTHRVQRKGLVKFIPTELSIDDIYNACKSDITIADITRLNKRNRDTTSSNADKWIPSQSLLFTFDGQILPKEIMIFNVKTAVEPYVYKPLQCFKCCHSTKSGCKFDQKCIMCGDLAHDGACSIETPKCANCEGCHKSISPECPKYLERKKINTMMAFDNLSFLEAQKIVCKEDQQSVSLKTKENYPPLVTNKHINGYSHAVKKKASKDNPNILASTILSPTNTHSSIGQESISTHNNTSILGNHLPHIIQDVSTTNVSNFVNLKPTLSSQESLREIVDKRTNQVISPIENFPNSQGQFIEDKSNLHLLKVTEILAERLNKENKFTDSGPLTVMDQ